MIESETQTCGNGNLNDGNASSNLESTNKESHGTSTTDGNKTGDISSLAIANGTATNDNIHATETVGDDSSDVIDELQKQLGGYGRYQMLVYVLLGIVYMRGGWHIWNYTFQVGDVGHHCSASPGLSLNQSVPSRQEKGEWIYDECLQYVNLTQNNDTKPCQNGWTYLYDSSYTSIVSEYSLVCDDDYQKELTSTMYMVGAACGVLFLPPLADRLGALKVMLACLWVQAVFGTCIIWAGNIIVFCVLKFFIGVTNMTVALCAYVLMTETFDSAHREMPTIALQFFWALGIMTMALFGYLIPKWEHLQLTITLPINVLSVIYLFIVPEPLPWLLSKGKVDSAENVINRFIRINRLPAIADLKKKLSMFKLDKKEKCKEDGHPYINTGYDVSDNNASEENKKDEKCSSEQRKNEESSGNQERVYTVLALFKTKKLRIYTLLMFYIFMINSLAYYGIMFSTPELNGNRFLNLFLLGVVEIPAYILCLVSNRFIGRRRSIAIFLLICAVTNLSVTFIPDESDDGVDLTKLKTALVIIGKFGITGSYSTIYLYASEVFPTVIRNQAVGASSFFENIGSIAAPNMVYANNSKNNLPLGIFGGLTILGSGLVLLLPETHNRCLPQTIEDVEQGYGHRKEEETTPTEIYRKKSVD